MSFDRPVPEENGSARQKFFGYWTFLELSIFGTIFILGLLVLFLHLYTWGRPHLEEVRTHRYVRGTVKRLVRHSYRDEYGAVHSRPELEVSYQVDGKTFVRMAFDATTLTPNQGYHYSEDEVVDELSRFRVGKSYRFVYPKGEPEKIVLEGDGAFWGWCFLITPVTLLIFSTFWLFWRARANLNSVEKRSQPHGRPHRYPTVPSYDRINDSPGTFLTYRLPVFFFPVAQTVVGLSLMILWNLAALIGFVYTLTIARTFVDYLLSFLFALIFCGAGWSFIPWLRRRIRTAFSAGPTLIEITDHPIYPGRKYRLAITQSGRLSHAEVSVFASCIETARYRQGTDTVTNRKEVFSLPLFSRSDWSIPGGESESAEFILHLPIGAMHSFNAGNNQIQWQIIIEIQSGKERKVTRLCPIVVMPFAPSDEMEPK